MKRCYKCKARLPEGRRNAKCTDCNRKYLETYTRKVKAELDEEREKRFPGVDIDAIHYKRGMVKK